MLPGGRPGFDQSNKIFDIAPLDDTPVTVMSEHTNEQNKTSCFQHKGSVTRLHLRIKIKRKYEPIRGNNDLKFGANIVFPVCI